MNFLFFISPFAPPNRWEPSPPLYALLHFPILYIARLLYRFLQFWRPLPTTQSPDPICVVTLSDTHCHIPDTVPDGDLLIHAGDLTNRGTVKELQAQIDWLKSLPHKHKIVIAGNHDTFLDERSRTTLDAKDTEPGLDWGDIHYMQHSSLELDFGERTLRVYAAPQIPTRESHPDWAFTYPYDSDAWSNTVPEDVDILVTHGPAKWHLDLYGIGCKWLLEEMWRARPKLHVFGHVHAGRGIEVLWWDDCQRIYESVSARSSGLLSVFNVFLWLDLARLVYFGVKQIVWALVWGGKEVGTIQINTALMYLNTGKLGHEPQVVFL